MTKPEEKPTAPPPPTTAGTDADPAKCQPQALPKEIGGSKGPEPTRYGDWEHNGRVSDF
jgi:hypothetical protein